MLYRCSECTLLRCSIPGDTCEECYHNMLAREDAARAMDRKTYHAWRAVPKTFANEDDDVRRQLSDYIFGTFNK